MELFVNEGGASITLQIFAKLSGVDLKVTQVTEDVKNSADFKAASPEGKVSFSLIIF